ncbi:caspase family protein [Myxococcus fulvus]|uniref:caspase family protein n=1 Tax=Myxococcus fulvus TaxID=33 RepID=UPI0020C04003|nr:caspase family protein [Myxococcus fulvus]MCK8501070.1 caspase family protein [Myxococcus fulvus]
MTSLRCLVVAAVLCASLPVEAGTRRIAVLVGHNVGSGERPPLRYAEADATKLAGVLSELGDVAPSDLIILKGQGLAPVRYALDEAARKVEALRRQPDTRVVLLFYFSGHSDGVALELGTERLLYSELRRWLDATRADVRLAIVDSCRSGALLRFKGGRPGPSFELRLTDEVHSTGHALLTSSAEDELALESREVGGSLFTHHLVSGLRGAADSSGDGLVTLAEAYQYAYAHTVSSTADVLTGAQHPAYDYRLTGKGELVLTQLPSPGTALELPSDFERALLLKPGRGQVLAELGPGAVPRLAVPPGEYELRAWRAGRQHVGAVNAAAGQVSKVRWDDLKLAPPSPTLAGLKGSHTVPISRKVVIASPEEWQWLEPTPEETQAPPEEAPPPEPDPTQEPRPWGAVEQRVAAAALPENQNAPEPLVARSPEPVTEGRTLDSARASAPLEISPYVPATPGDRELTLTAGMRHTVVDPAGALLAFRAELSKALQGLTFALEVGQGPHEENREFTTGLTVGYAIKKRYRYTELALGVEAGLQVVVQTGDGDSGWTMGPSAAPVASFALYVVPQMAVTVGGRLPVVVVRLDERTQWKFIPAADVGLRIPF